MASTTETVIENLFRDTDSCVAHYKSYCYENAPRIWADANFVSSLTNNTDSILDVGAVPPLMAGLLSTKGYKNVTICDPLPNSFTKYFQGQGINFHQVDLINDSEHVLNEEFDFVCLNEVVEHLAGNLISALSNVTRYVKRGGRLLVTTPNQRSLTGLASLLCCQSGMASKPHDSVRAQYDRKSAEWGYYGHVREYTSKEIIDLIESFGFKLVAKHMQPNYLNRGRLFKIVARLEYATPAWRLFGKYVFQKLQ